ncbi:MAG: response regulator [Sphingobacteriales bacterium]
MRPQTIRIAVAEDHTLVRHSLIEHINGIPNCKVIADGENGKVLIENISLLEQKPDIVILDVSMPVLNGYDTLIALKKTYPAMKFLVLTMFENNYCIVHMIKIGANGYLLKNCTPIEFKEAILSIYNNGYYFSPKASEKAFAVVKHNKMPELTGREVQFICLCYSGLSFEKIAEIMCVSVRTLDDYQRNIGKKLNLHTREDLALFAVYSGLVSINQN